MRRLFLERLRDRDFLFGGLPCALGTTNDFVTAVFIRCGVFKRPREDTPRLHSPEARDRNNDGAMKTHSSSNRSIMVDRYLPGGDPTGALVMMSSRGCR